MTKTYHNEYLPGIVTFLFMKTNRVSLKLATLLIGTALTSCIDGNKNRISTEFIHPDLNIDYIKKTNSKGVGYVKDVELTDSIDQYKVEKGKFVFEMKCATCHKLTDQRLVGPGWAGITNNRRPEWIMNMITNTDEMLEKDEVARIQLEDCLTRMPNQDISMEQARSILEFMRKNDLDQVSRKDGAAKNANY